MLYCRKTGITSSQSPGSPSWNKSVETLNFDEAKFVLTRHWTCGISEERESGEMKKGNNKETTEIPKAWLDMMDKSNLFPRRDSHTLHRYFGLKDFVVIEHHSSIGLEDPHRVIREFSSIACKNGWHVPVFWKNRCSEIYAGILEWPGFKTIFTLINNDFRGDPHCMSSFYDLFRNRDVPNDEPVAVSARLTYTFHETLDYPSKGLCCSIGCGMMKDEYYHFYEYGHLRNNFELHATWSDPLEYKDCGITSKWILNPLDAPDWSVRVKVIDTSDVPLGDCLTMFLSLYSSQTGTLLSNPQITSMLKCRRIYKHKREIQGSGRKVTLVWVLAHVGIPGNEKADALAKAATARDQIDYRIPASIKDVKRSVARNIFQQWQTRWDEDPRNQRCKKRETSVDEEQVPMCLNEEGGSYFQTPSWKVCSESSLVSHETAPRRKM